MPELGSSGSVRAEGGNVLIYSELCTTIDVLVIGKGKDIRTMKDLTPAFDPSFCFGRL